MITLDEIINGYMLQNELPEQQQYRIEQLAIRGYRQLHYHSIGKPRSCELEISANGTAYLPCDFLAKLRLGLVNSKGEIQTLLEDNLLSTTDRTPSPNLGGDISDNMYYDNYGYYPFMGQQLGIGSLQTSGSYKIDYENQVVIFNTGFRQDNVQLEYLPLVDEDDDYVVHPFFQEALISWINWQDKKGNAKYISERQINEQDFEKAHWKAKRAMKPFNVGDMYNQYRQSVRMAVKS